MTFCVSLTERANRRLHAVAYFQERSEGDVLLVCSSAEHIADVLHIMELEGSEKLAALKGTLPETSEDDVAVIFGPLATKIAPHIERLATSTAAIPGFGDSTVCTYLLGPQDGDRRALICWVHVGRFHAAVVSSKTQARIIMRSFGEMGMRSALPFVDGWDLPEHVAIDAQLIKGVPAWVINQALLLAKACGAL